MKITQIRIELTDDVYHLLKDEQQNRKNNSEKKVSLNDLALEYFMAGLQNKLSGIENIADNSQQPNSNLPAVIMLKEKSLELTQSEQLLLKKEISLRNEEEYIRAVRSELREQEQNIRDQMHELYKMKDETADEKEEIRQMRIENIEQNFNLKILTNDLAKKNEEIHQLKDMIIYLKEQTLKTLDKLGVKLDSKPDKNILTDYILPILPSIISSIGFYFTNKNISGNDNKLPVKGELEDVYQKLGAEEKDKLSSQIRDLVSKKFNHLKPK